METIFILQCHIQFVNDENKNTFHLYAFVISFRFNWNVALYWIAVRIQSRQKITLKIAIFFYCVRLASFCPFNSFFCCDKQQSLKKQGGCKLEPMHIIIHAYHLRNLFCLVHTFFVIRNTQRERSNDKITY